MSSLALLHAPATAPSKAGSFMEICYEAADSIINHTYHVVPFKADDLSPLIIAGVAKWFEDPIARMLGWDHDNPNDPDTGTLIRDGRERVGAQNNDIKDIFHYRPSLWSLLRRCADESLIERHRSFLLACHTIRERGLRTVKPIQYAISKRLSAPHLSARMLHPSAQADHVIRVVQYHPNLPQGLEIAGDHFDRNTLTLDMFNNLQGLHVYPHGSREKELVGLHKDGAVVFAGHNFLKVNEPRVTPLRHGATEIRSKADRALGRRVAIILFARMYMGIL